MQLVIFCIITVLLILKPVFTSLLLSDYGIEIVPKAYMLIALVAVVCHIGMVRLSTQMNIYKKFQSNLLIQSVIIFLMGLAIHLEVSGLAIIYYLYVSMFALFTVTYFYQYCQVVLTIREAKRILAYIGSGAIAGGIFGGYLASILVNIFGNGILVMTSVLFLILAFIFLKTFHLSGNFQTSEDEDDEPQAPEKNQALSGLFYSLKHTHVINVSMVIGLGVLVAKLVDYQFNFLVSNAYSDSEELTTYLGFWFSNINVMSLLIQLFIMKKVVDRLGVLKSMAVLPALIFFGTIVLVFAPVLLIGILLKAIDGSLKQSIYKSTTELVTMPLPSGLRSRAKSFIDVVIDSIATGIAGVIIIILGIFFEQSLVGIALVTLMFSGLWIWFINKTHGSYQQALKNMLTFELEDDEEEVQKAVQDSEWRKSIIQAREKLQKLSSNIIKLAPELLNPFKIRGRKILIEDLYDQLNSPEDIEQLFETLSLENKILLTATIASDIGGSPKTQREYKLYEKIESCLESLYERSENDAVNPTLLYQIYLSICKAKFKKRYPLIKEALEGDSGIRYQHYALKAIRMSKLRKMYYDIDIRKIDPENIQSLYLTLATFPSKTHAYLKLLLKTNKKKFIQILPSTRFIGSQKNINLLFEFLNHSDLRIRRQVLINLHECRKRFPNLNYKNKSVERKMNTLLMVVKKLLVIEVSISEHQKEDMTDVMLATYMRSVQHELKRSVFQIFIYLSLITGRYDLGIIYQSIKLGEKEKALDFLDGILPFRIKENVLPVLEAVLIHENNMTNISLLGVQKIYSLPRSIKYLKSILGELPAERKLRNIN